MKIRSTGFVFAAVFAAVLVGCADKLDPIVAESIYFNGPIITVDADESIAEAIAIGNGRILAIGDSEDILQMSDKSTRVVDLQGKTMLPGFVDGHSHLSGVSIQAITANLLPPPDGPVKNIPELQ